MSGQPIVKLLYTLIVKGAFHNSSLLLILNNLDADATDETSELLTTMASFVIHHRKDRYIPRFVNIK